MITLFEQLSYLPISMKIGKKSTSTMPVSRQIRYFKESRENWKERALEKSEQLRFSDQKIDDLERSRDKWKTEALENRAEIKKLKKEIENLKKKPTVEELVPTKEPLLTVKAAQYIAQTIQVSVEQVVESSNSYRGVATTMKILSRIYFTESPHYSSIRNWVGRIGLYELSRQKEKRDDWIFIIDLTLELGQEKAMVIYGISEKLWTEKILV